MLDANTIIDYSHKDFMDGIRHITHLIRADQYAPDYIVGIVRGGAIPAVYLSHHLKVPVVMLHWSSRDHNLVSGNESNTWIPEDINAGKRILIVDDIVDGGETIRQILDDWQSSALAGLNLDNIKIASLFYNTAQDISVDYCHHRINRNEDSRWVVFDWEA